MATSVVGDVVVEVWGEVADQVCVSYDVFIYTDPIEKDA